MYVYILEYIFSMKMRKKKKEIERHNGEKKYSASQAVRVKKKFNANPH